MFPRAIFYLPVLLTICSSLERRQNLQEYSGSRPIPDDLETDNQDTQQVSVDGDVSTKFYLYTKSNPYIGEEYYDAVDLKTSKRYQKTKQNVFIIHGWKNNYQSPVNQIIKTALLEKQDVNIFVVDWSYKASNLYVMARYNVPAVGGEVANFINELIDNFGITPKDFVLIGHSLGAHVCGIAGQYVQGPVNSIIGLDPAMPLFTLSEPDTCLDQTDGEFVQIIHTNGGRLGIQSAIGHVDYYPNGGDWQPGCGLDFGGSYSHARAYQYLAESIRTGGFTSILCPNYEMFNNFSCDQNHKSYLGSLDVDKAAYGDYYLNTSSTDPFSMF